MRRAGLSARLPFAIGAVLLAALAALALLQYRWIARLSEAEEERLRAALDAGASRISDGFDRELSRVARHFRPADGLPEESLPAELAASLARWRSAPEANLVRELLIVTRTGREGVELQRFDEGSGSLVPSASTPETDSLRRIFEIRGKVPRLDGRLPGLIVPVRPHPPPREDGTPEQAERRPPRHHLVVRLDRDTITKELLPRLAARELGGADGLAYEVRVVLADEPHELVYRGGPALAGAPGREADTSRPLFALRPSPESGAPGTAAPAAWPGPRGTGERDAAARDGRERDGGTEAGRWRLEVRHPSGSLEAAVADARRRNLAIGLAVLLLLGSAIALLVLTTRRAQTLARQQMDFVAAVSHELKTPLTAMRSAGQNLADGIVSDPAKVRKYGALVEREGRRLTEMVGRVLAFAGLRSGSQAFRAEPVPVRPLVEAVLADSRWVLEEKQIHVETDLGDSLPGIRGDEQALRQALTNLLDNALKYGGAARWIGIRAFLSTGPGGHEVVLSVSDRGPGIRRGDLSRLFEPFFRSAEASAAGIGGSGLGLAVVRGIAEGHGGRVTVESVPGKGSTFALHLPTAPASGPESGREAAA